MPVPQRAIGLACDFHEAFRTERDRAAVVKPKANSVFLDRSDVNDHVETGQSTHEHTALDLSDTSKCRTIDLDHHLLPRPWQWRRRTAAEPRAKGPTIARLTITNWLKQDDLDAGRRADGLTTAESVEVAKLRKKVRELEIERDILKKAAENSTDQRNTSFSLLAGVPYCKVLRGRWFSLRAMRLRSA